MSSFSIRSADFQSEEKKLRALQLLVQLLPRPNHALLRALLELLHDVSCHSATTLMPARNLAMAFVPHLLVSRDASEAAMLRSCSGPGVVLVENMIQLGDQVFQVCVSSRFNLNLNFMSTRTVFLFS